jgi:hypothetical protein
VQGQPDLLEVIRTLEPVGRLADLLHRREQQADQDADDRDDNEKLDERKGGALDVLHGCSWGVAGTRARTVPAVRRRSVVVGEPEPNQERGGGTSGAKDREAKVS